MLKDSLISRAFIRTAIVSIRSLTPACGIYLAGRFICSFIPQIPRLHPLASLLLFPVDIYAELEVAFYFFVYLPRRRYLNQPAPPLNPLPTPLQRRETFQKTWEATRDPKGYLSLWFKGADVEGLHREDVKDWIHWRLWNGVQHEYGEEVEIEEYVQYLEELIKMKLLPGRGQHKSMMVTIEPLRMAHRPLLWYQVRAPTSF